jgi:autotransporter-associated beta strand protein
VESWIVEALKVGAGMVSRHRLASGAAGRCRAFKIEDRKSKIQKVTAVLLFLRWLRQGLGTRLDEIRTALMKKFSRQLSALGLPALLALFFTPASLFAGSATWNLNPTSGNWNTAANWTPATVPNGLSDIATFETSNTTSVSLSGSVTLNGITFEPGASMFTITSPSPFAGFLINGVGIVNNSGVEQTFIADVNGRDQGDISFAGAATAGDATYSIIGSSARNSFGAGVSFFNFSTAANANFTLDGGHAENTSGGGALFFDSSTANAATFTINGGTVSGATGGHLEFVHTSNADHATLIANGGTNGAGGGTIFFLDDSLGGRAKITLLGNGTLDLDSHSRDGVTIGGLQGDGLVFLGAVTLTVHNKPDNNFGGVISGSGSLIKGADRTLRLLNANTYSGGTVIRDGTLLANNTTGSATGPGPVLVKMGALGGTGTIAGDVNVGAGIPGNGAFIFPGVRFGNPGVLTILGELTFDSDGFFNCGFRATTIGQLIANGVNIDPDAQFSFFNNGGDNLPVGTVSVIINNTAATPIAGEFENLQDGLVFTSGANRFEVSYQGGDGNDLTLTRIQ